MTKKIKKISFGNSARKMKLVWSIGDLIKGLVYTSETEAPFEVFVELEAAEFYGDLEKENRPIDEVSCDKFFARLVKTQDRHGDKEKEMARKFLRLKEFLDSNLNHPRVFRVGRVQIDIYVVGLAKNGKLIGVKQERWRHEKELQHFRRVKRAALN